jgi:hypothetical protein
MADDRHPVKGEHLRLDEFIELLTRHTKHDIIVVFPVEKAVTPAAPFLFEP